MCGVEVTTSHVVGRWYFEGDMYVETDRQRSASFHSSNGYERCDVRRSMVDSGVGGLQYVKKISSWIFPSTLALIWYNGKKKHNKRTCSFVVQVNLCDIFCSCCSGDFDIPWCHRIRRILSCLELVSGRTRNRCYCNILLDHSLLQCSETRLYVGSISAVAMCQHALPAGRFAVATYSALKCHQDIPTKSVLFFITEKTSMQTSFDICSNIFEIEGTCLH